MNPSTDYLRLRTRPKPETPPQGSVDLFYDAATSVLKMRDPAGNETGAGVSSATVQEAISDDPEGALTALTPTRILFLDDLPATWFNGSSTELLGVVPLTSAQAVVGTKVRVRGTVRVHFQGASPDLGEDTTVALVFNVAADAANQVEGVGLVVNAAATNFFHIDIELELKTAPSSTYKLGLGANTPSYLASINRAALTFDRWGNTGDSTAFVIDPTVAEDVGSTAGLVVQLQAFGGSIDQSICNCAIDINYEVVTA